MAPAAQDLRLYISRFNPTEDYLQFEFDMNWQTVSSHILVKATAGLLVASCTHSFLLYPCGGSRKAAPAAFNS